MLFRMITIGYTAFLAGFCKDYAASANLSHAFNAGIELVIQGAVAGFGVDQLFYHHSQTSNLD